MSLRPVAVAVSAPVLDVAPTELHQRTPLYIGSASEVELVARTLAEVSPQLVGA